MTEICQQVEKGTDACVISYGGPAAGQSDKGALVRELMVKTLCASAETKRHSGAVTQVTVQAQILHRSTTIPTSSRDAVVVPVTTAQQGMRHIRKIFGKKTTANRHTVVTIELTVTLGHSHVVSRFTEVCLAWTPPKPGPGSSKLWAGSHDMQVLNNALVRIDSSAESGRVVNAPQRVNRSELPLVHAVKHVLHSQSHLVILACVSPLASDARASAHCLHFAHQFKKHVEVVTKTENLAQSKLQPGLLELYIRVDEAPAGRHRKAGTSAAAAAGEISWDQLREPGAEATGRLFEVAAPDGLWFPFKTTNPLILPPNLQGQGMAQLESRLTGHLLGEIFEGRHLLLLAAGSASKQAALAYLMRVCTDPFISLFTQRHGLPGWAVEVSLRVTDVDTDAPVPVKGPERKVEEGDRDSVRVVCEHSAVSGQEFEEVLGVATSYLANTVQPVDGLLRSGWQHHRVVDLIVTVRHVLSGYMFQGSFCMANLATGPKGQYALTEILARRGGRPASRNSR